MAETEQWTNTQRKYNSIHIIPPANIERNKNNKNPRSETRRTASKLSYRTHTHMYTFTVRRKKSIDVASRLIIKRNEKSKSKDKLLRNTV